jgi:excisionase family DNA binding protein
MNEPKSSLFSEAHNVTAQRSAPLLQYAALVDDAEAARFLGGLHPKTVQRMAKRGELPSYRIGKYWRYRISELSNWLVLHSSGQNNPLAQTQKEIIQ